MKAWVGLAQTILVCPFNRRAVITVALKIDARDDRQKSIIIGYDMLGNLRDMPLVLCLIIMEVVGHGWKSLKPRLTRGRDLLRDPGDGYRIFLCNGRE
jgi:hypothetical protein